MATNVKIGDVVGRLTVQKLIGRFKAPGHQGLYPLFECLCACGKNKNVFSYELGKRNHTRSCGCLGREALKLCHKKLIQYNQNRRVPIEKHIYHTYKSNAHRRQLEFNLNFNEFLNLIKKPCVYCQRQPFSVFRKHNQACYFNGLDRVNNSLGYLVDNVVTCCKFCNRLKGVQDKDIFLDTVLRINANYQVNFQSIDEVVNWRRSLQDKKFRLSLVTGCFDIYHPGYDFYLKSARSYGDLLLVGINSDDSVRALKGHGRPINNQTLRKQVLDSIKYVHATFIYNNTQEFLQLIRPDVWVKGGDYTLETLNKIERDTVLNNGGKIEFVPFEHEISTTKILQLLK